MYVTGGMYLSWFMYLFLRLGEGGGGGTGEEKVVALPLVIFVGIYRCVSIFFRNGLPPWGSETSQSQSYSCPPVLPAVLRKSICL